MTWSEADHLAFYRHLADGCIYLIVYVYDIVITDNDHHGITEVETTEDIGRLRY